MEEAAELYTSCLVCKEELIEEKICVLGDIIYHLNKLYFKHSTSKYVMNAIAYIYAYSMQFLSELQREHVIYDYLINYFESFEFITDLTDPVMLEKISDVFDLLDDAMEQRIIYYANFLDRVDDIISWPVLTDNCYYIPNFVSTLTDEDTVKIVNQFVPIKK